MAGGPAGTFDSENNTKTKAPIVFGFVLILAFVLLLVMFRSIIIPIKAIVLNLLSVGVAYGVLVLVFQEGVGEGLLNFQAAGTIEIFMPLFLLAVLFGLSMDYHMLVLNRVKEAYNAGSSNEASVSLGIKSTAALITSAALVMVLVFAAFATSRIMFFQQIGVGLGVAILIDATIIRAILLPASMKLLGDLNWYLPKWLEWLPRVSAEGNRNVEVTGANTDPAISARRVVGLTRHESEALKTRGGGSAGDHAMAPATTSRVHGRVLWIKFLTAWFQARTWRSVLYLLLGLPLGITYFTFLVTGFSVGASLIIIYAGFPVLALTLIGARLCCKLEAGLANVLQGADIVQPRAPWSGEGSIWARTKRTLTDRATWKGGFFLFAMFPLGIATFTIAVTLVSTAFLGATVLIWSRWSDWQVAWQLRVSGEGFFFVIGVLLVFASPHLLNLIVSGQSRFAHRMLSDQGPVDGQPA